MHREVRDAPVGAVAVVAARRRPTSTSTTGAPTTSTSTKRAPTTAPATTTTVMPPQTVHTQTPTAGTVLHPGAPVAFTMHACPQ